MPTPRKVLGVSSSSGKCQRRRTHLRAHGVARGTTLHKTAACIGAPRANFESNFSAAPWNQAAVGILVCRRTRRELARPRWVLVLPMSKRRIILFLKRNISADDSFQMAMVGAQ